MSESIDKSKPNDRELVITRVVSALRELVWKVWTEPEHVAKWWGPNGFSTTIEVMDVRPGGEWKHTMHGPDGVNYPNHAKFIEVVKPERIVLKNGGHREGGAAVSFVATWTFEVVSDKQTRVTIRTVFPSVEERDRVVREFGAVEGGKQCLANLGDYVAKM